MSVRRKRKLDRLETDVGDDNDLHHLESKRNRLSNGVAATTDKKLLPVKLSGHLVSRVLRGSDVKTEEGDLDEGLVDEATTTAETPEDSVQLTAPQLYAERMKKLTELKSRISHLASDILQDPNANAGKLKTLQEISENRSDALVSSTAQKLATASLLEIYVDIIPQYQIRSLTDAERAEKASKETRQLREYEETLLRNYKRYLQHLEKWVKAGVLKSAELNQEKREKLILGLKAMCRLLAQHPHFNFRSNILTLVVQFANSKLKDVSQLCCTCLRQLFVGDLSGEVSLEAIRLIRSVLTSQQSHHRISPNLLDVLTSLKVTRAKDSFGGPGRKKIDRSLVSKKQRKRAKETIQFEKHLNELEMDQSVSKWTKLKSSILDHVITIYFLILRSNETSGLGVALKGLSHFAPMINVDFVPDLINTLSGMVERPDLDLHAKLHCINTVLVLLSQEGQAINVDPQHFYHHMYRLLMEMTTEIHQDQVEMFRLCLAVLRMMIVDRRKQISLARAAAFFKRICLLATSGMYGESGPLLTLAQRVLVAHPSLDRLFDSETLDSGKYLWSVDDPEHSNAVSAGAFETCLLRNHCAANVRNLTDSLLTGKVLDRFKSNAFKESSRLWEALQPWNFSDTP